MDGISWAQTIVLAIVQGLTEFLPISSSGHLNIVSRLFWGSDAGASFTAVIQLGTELAVLVFFAKIFSGSSKRGSVVCLTPKNVTILITKWAGTSSPVPSRLV